MYGDVPEFIIRDALPMEEKKLPKFTTNLSRKGLRKLKRLFLKRKQVVQTVYESDKCSLILTQSVYQSTGTLKETQSNLRKANIFDGVTPKLDRILEYAEEGEPLIIFGTFTAEIEKIAEHLASKKYKVGVIHGGVPQNRRNNIDLEFQRGNLDVVVCSAATAGIGFNWGHVNTVIFHSLNYGDDEFLQAVALAKRGVRKEPLRIVVLEA